MATGHVPQRGNPRGWRRKWRRVPAAHRQAAAETLDHLFTPAPRRWRPLTIVCAASLAAHLATVPALRRAAGPAEQIAAREKTYLRKVLQTERARGLSREAQDQLIMPPPPPDPEELVSDTLTSEITTDIERVIGKMLDVDVTGKLTAAVTSDLRAELEEAAKTIAAGELSDEEIKTLQEEFKRKAHERTVTALRRHREDTQLEQARLSVKDWYERRVAHQLKHKMSYELFGRTHGGVWHHYYSRSHWGMLRLWYGDCFHYRRTVDRLAGLAAGIHYDPRGTIGGRPLQHGQRTLPDWPKPTAKQADGLARVARGIHAGYHGAGWRAAALGYLRGFRPQHETALLAREVRQIEARWTQLFDAVATFRAKAEAAAPEPERTAAQKAALAAVKALHAAAAALLVADEGGYCAVNQAVRSRVLRGPVCRRVYDRYVTTLVDAFRPAILDLARNEFREGVIIREKGVDQATEAFAREVLKLLRRDVEAVIPFARFEALLFEGSVNPYRSLVTGKPCPPSPEQIERDEQTLAAAVAKWPAERKTYPEARANAIARDFDAVVQQVARALIAKLVDDGRFSSRFYASVESADHTDRVEQRLNARRRAMTGRGQDLAELTDDGVPDASAAMVALRLGASKGHGASLEPLMAERVPGYRTPGDVIETALHPAPPRFPPRPRSWGRVTQPRVKPPFKKYYRCEGIPFLANFPNLDGDLRDWGKIRPLVTQPIRYLKGPKQVLMIYAAWNYQGYFFGYHVDQPAYRFTYPEATRAADSLGLVMQRATGYRWAYRGDYLRLLFDTLDSRNKLRGEPHTQEFVIFPRGLEGSPNVPGIERIIESTRNATRRHGQWGEIIARTNVFPAQPGPELGPDGTGPYRVTRLTKTGYTTEVFLPRTLFNVPVFCPGWYVGFEAVVAIGHQGRYPGRCYGRLWANPWWNGHGELGDKDYPHHWGDLLLLGTDPHVVVQNADAKGARTRAVVPGHSYLLTVVDPDRNVNLAARDIVVASAEVLGGPTPGRNDVEIFILKESANNSSVFRGYVNTQPGRGRDVQGVVELLPGQQVRLGYLDLANAEGRRNVVYRVRLPVVAGLSTVSLGAP